MEPMKFETFCNRIADAFGTGVVYDRDGRHASTMTNTEKGKPSIMVGFVKYDEDKEGKGHWSVPKVEIDSYWGNPRIAVVDPNGNFCCLSYNRDTNEFSEGQFWRNGGLSLAAGVKAKLDLYIQMFKDGYDMKIE
jgi:hypothetical protein